MFQSTHPRGVRPTDTLNEGTKFEFQSTHPRGVRRTYQGTAHRELQVSIHAPAGGATKHSRLSFTDEWFQSTHPRGVRLLKLLGYPLRVIVSIHAPAGGATSVGYFAHSIVRMFQSTHPRGVRRLFFGIFARVRWVSIHAPAGGATSSTPYKGGMNSFQSTHPRGVRRLDCTTCGSWHCFNPRTRGGCDCKEKP